jgi:hypothetical protein
VLLRIGSGGGLCSFRVPESGAGRQAPPTPRIIAIGLGCVPVVHLPRPLNPAPRSSTLGGVFLCASVALIRCTPMPSANSLAGRRSKKNAGGKEAEQDHDWWKHQCQQRAPQSPPSRGFAPRGVLVWGETARQVGTQPMQHKPIYRRAVGGDRVKVVRLTASNAALPSSGRPPYFARPRRDGTTPDCLAADNDARAHRYSTGHDALSLLKASRRSVF